MTHFSRTMAPLASLLIVALISGCALAPGAHIDHRSEALPLDDLVDIQPITPGLVAGYQRNGQRVAQSMPELLREDIASFEYRVAAGDVLSVIVYEHPELTIPAGAERRPEDAGSEVRRDGTIFYPYVGRVHVAGKTLDEIRDVLTEGLADYITEPQVDVAVAAYRSQKVYVSGAVQNPGALPVTAVPLTVADAVSQAGGALADANWHEVMLTRDGEETVLSLYALFRQGDLSQNRLLRDGDALHVPTAEDRAVAMLGQVRSPGAISVGNEPVSLTDALARVGGLDEITAQPSGIFVIRPLSGDNGKIASVYQLDVSNAMAFSLGNRFELQPQDTVYVTTAPVARWNRVISQILPTINLGGGTARALRDYDRIGN